MKRLSISLRPAGFTLTEVLVSSALIVAVMALMLTTVDQTRRTIERTTNRVNQFQSARLAFEALTRNLSQATLNTYYDLDYATNGNPSMYRRQSDLHFVSGRASTHFSGENEAEHPTHAVFFQAPLGATVHETGNGANAVRTFSPLGQALSTVGYHVAWGKDTTVPTFLSTGTFLTERNRFRLMEVMQPAETSMIYYNSNYYTLQAGASTTKTTPEYNSPLDWIQAALGRKDLPSEVAAMVPGTGQNKRRPEYSRVLAENIVALIIVPKEAEAQRSSPDSLSDLTSNFEYDSRPMPAYVAQGRVPSGPPGSSFGDVTAQVKAMEDGTRKLLQMHQLPPIIQVTMVAIDEESGRKLDDYTQSSGGTPPNFAQGLFNNLSTVSAFQRELGDPANLSKTSLIYKISNPDRNLPTPRLNYRVFTTDVVMRGSKWTKFSEVKK